MDNSLMIAILGSAIAIVGVVISMMFWCRQESNAVRLEMKEDRRDFMQLVRSIDYSISEMRQENKDFHYRLLEIEKEKVRRN